MPIRSFIRGAVEMTGRCRTGSADYNRVALRDKMACQFPEASLTATAEFGLCKDGSGSARESRERGVMRFIHTADWHLGRLFHGVHLTEDQRHVLDQLIDLAKSEKPDALLIAGDIYDRAVPPPEAVELLDDVLSRLVLEAKVPVVLIAGNHDSPNRLAFGARLMRERRLYVTGNVSWPCAAIPFSDEHGPVHVYALPYAEPSIVRQCLECEEVTDHHTAMQAMAGRIRAGHPKNERSILLAHAFVSGGAECESERPLSVGGSGCVQRSCFDGFDYVALGHLHGPQHVNGEDPHPSPVAGSRLIRSLLPAYRERGKEGGVQSNHGAIWYSGSLLKYSFEECAQRKGVSLVEIDGRGHCAVRCIALSPRRDVRRVSGTMAQMLEGPTNGESKEDYLEVTLMDEGPVLDAIGRLREVYPNVMLIRRPEGFRAGVGGDRPNIRGMDEVQLFNAFFQHVTGAEMAENQRGAFSGIVERMRQKEREGAT